MGASLARETNAHAQVESTVEDLRSDIRKYLEDQGGSATLSQLRHHLQTVDSRDALTGRAVAAMLSAGMLFLTRDRRIHLRIAR